MNLVVRAFPVVPGREAEVRALAQRLRDDAGEALAFFARYGIAHESWHLQTTPHGSWVIAVTQVADRVLGEAAQEFSDSEHPFDRWFKDQVYRVSGINPDEQPLGPPTTLLFDTRTLAEAAPIAAVVPGALAAG